MKIKLEKSLLGLILLALVFVAFGSQTTPDHKMLFEKAQYTMETKGDLEAAIKIFEDVIAKFPDEREYAARSQFLIGECYEKLGRSGAIKAYESVVSDYADQTDLVSAARSRLTNLQTPSADVVQVTPISLGDFYLEGGILSPDGTRLAGVSYEIGQNIAVMNVGENKVTQVTKFGWGQERGIWTHQPVWSPDGKSIAFQGGGWYDKQGVEMRTTTLDGKQRTLYTCAKGEGGYPIEWLPKGDLILRQLNSGGVNTLGVISVSDGKFRPLRKLPGGTDGSSSPDGKYIVFYERKGESRNLSIISTDGKKYKPLTEGPADDKQPHWSPDGRHIVFLSHRHGGWALWGIAVDKEGNPAGNPSLLLPATKIMPTKGMS
jgi:hypothetical protein